MFFETLVKVIFQEPLSDYRREFFLINNPSEEDVNIVDDKTILFSWKYFHAFMSTILILDTWDVIKEIWPNGSHPDLELYFRRDEGFRMNSSAFKFYIDASPTRAIVVCPQCGDLEFREIFLDGWSHKIIPPSTADLEIFVRRYFSWVWLKDEETKRLDAAFKRVVGVTLEEYYSVYEEKR